MPEPPEESMSTTGDVAMRPPTVQKLPIGGKRDSAAASTEASPLAEVLPEVPGYAIESVLGRGGMGVVYKARHLALKRTVAIKMMLAGNHAGELDRTRFKAEAEAVARLQHPNIVQVHEVGEHQGCPYCALEFVVGGSLDRKLAGNPLPAEQAVALAELLARAMEVAHQARVIHRDLKPANVLLSADGTPKITDFGLAKKLDEASQTQTGAVMGTPSYMAPEQAVGSKEIGPAVDVYALGAILYEILTGRPPFKAANAYDTILQIMADEPVPPTRLNPKVPRDLETVCLKCLHKEPQRRYASAAALGDDLRRLREGEPIQARPVGRVERAIKWVRRNPVVAALLALVVIVAAVGFGAFWVKYLEAQDKAEIARAKTEYAEEQAGVARTRQGEAEKALKEKDRALDLANDQLAANALILAKLSWDTGAVGAARGQLDSVPEKPHRLRNFEWHFLRRQYEGGLFSLPGHTGPHVAFNPDGTRLTTVSYDRWLRVWNARNGALERECKLNGTDRIWTAVFSPDGTQLATTSKNNLAQTWNARTGALAFAFEDPAEKTLGAGLSSTRPAFSPDSTRLAVPGLDGKVRLWDTRTGALSLELKGHAGRVAVVAFSPDGARLATGSFDKLVVGKDYRIDATLVDRAIRIWDSRSGMLVRETRGESMTTDLAFSPDGERVAACGGGKARLLNANTGTLEREFEVPSSVIVRVAFSPDGTRLLGGAANGTGRLWDVVTGALALELKGHVLQVISTAYSPDGALLVTGSADGTVRVWDVRSDVPAAKLAPHDAPLVAAAFGPDGAYLASVGHDGMPRIWDSRTGKLVKELARGRGALTTVAYSPDGTHLAAAGMDRVIRLWDVRSGTVVRELDCRPSNIRTLAFSPDGIHLAAALFQSKTAWVWDTRSGKRVLELKGHTALVSAFAYSRDGTRLATASFDNTARVWDARTGTLVSEFKGHTSMVLDVAFSPDGTRLATASADQTARLWDAGTGKEMISLKSFSHAVQRVAFSPDGTRLATTSADRMLRLWDTRMGALALEVKCQITSSSHCLAFSPDGTRLATVADGRVLLLNGRFGTADAIEMGYREWAARPDPAWHASEGRRLGNEGRYFAAAFHFRRWMELRPGDASAYDGLGYVMERQGRLALAERLLRKAIDLGPRDANAHNSLGWVLSRQGKSVEAEKLYRKAIELDPKLVFAHFNLGTMRVRQGEPREAEAFFRRAMELAPAHIDARVELGMVLQMQGKSAQAEEVLRTAVGLKPEYAHARVMLAWAQERQDKLQQAETHLRKAIALDDRNVAAHSDIGWVLQRQDKFKEAERFLYRALEIDVNHEFAAANLATVLQRQDKWDEAVALYRKLLDVKTKSEWARSRLPHAERMADLLAKLPAYVKGDFRPGNSADQRALAEMSERKRFFRAAARGYAALLAEDAKRAGNQKPDYREAAARCAAFVAAGQGEDAIRLDDEEKARWRKQACDWLRADLETWRGMLGKGSRNGAAAVADKLELWLKDDDFRTVRGAKALATLPEAERRGWEKLWADVADMVEQAQAKSRKK
jgi:WD40 repeat protein/Flp pilus assembly protein TadD/tRNA A-37 threonylcarbamoyl transferase component Bud32